MIHETKQIITFIVKSETTGFYYSAGANQDNISASPYVATQFESAYEAQTSCPWTGTLVVCRRLDVVAIDDFGVVVRK